MIIPSRCAPFVYGVIQAAITTGVASAVATLRVAPLSSAWIADLVAWAIAWAAMLPVVVFAAPLMQHLVQAITSPHRTRLRWLASSFPGNITDATSGPCGCSTANTQFRNLRSIGF